MGRTPRGILSRRAFLKAAGLAAGACAAAPLLGACGAAASGPVKIGVLLPYSAVYAALGVSIENGLRLYFEQSDNVAGGRELQLITEDEGATPDEATPKARKLVEQDEVHLMTGIVSSGVLGALRDYFISNDLLLICANAGSNALSRSLKTPHVWRTSFTNWMPSWAIGGWAAQNVGRRAVISVPDYAAGNDTIAAFTHAFEAAGGTITYVQKTPFPNIGDAAPFITELTGQDADFLYCFYSGGQAVTFLKAYSDFGLGATLPLLCSGFMVEEDVLPAHGGTALGVRSSLHWALGLDNPENARFKEAYRERFGVIPDVFAVQGYDTGRVIVEMLNATQGDTATAGLIAALDGLSFASPRGPFALDPVTQAPRHHMYLREVQSLDGAPHNVVLADLGEVADPGDDSKG